MKSFQIACLSGLLTLCLSAGAQGPGNAQAQPGATPASAAANAPSPEMKQFQALEDAWSTALVKQDQYGLENVLAPTYVGISGTGEVSTRNQQIAKIFQRDLAPQSMEQRVASVRMYTDLAVVNGTYIVSQKQGGQRSEEKGIFTHVYQRARNGWLCINSQRTLVVEQGGVQKASKSQKKSDAQLPLHIPLLHKGDPPASTPPADTSQPQ